MRAIIDANVWLSLFTTNTKESFTEELLKQIVFRKISVVMFPKLQHEVITKLAVKKRISTKVKISKVEQIFKLIEHISIAEDPLRHSISKITRDKKDDYLINFAVEHDIDYIVTWDKDLLDLKEKVKHPIIISPTQFFKIIKNHNE